MLKTICLTIFLISLLGFTGCATVIPVYQSISPVVLSSEPGNIVFEFVHNSISEHDKCPYIKIFLENKGSSKAYFRCFLTNSNSENKRLVFSKVLKSGEFLEYILDGLMFNKWMKEKKFLMTMDYNSVNKEQVSIQPVLYFQHYKDIYQWIKEVK